MPFTKDPGKRESDKYCSYCYKNGELTYKGNDLKEFQRICYKGMVENGTNKLMAWFFAFCIRFAPRWRK